MIEPQLRTGPWFLADLKRIKPNGLKVFSCFHCGGGSSMGYKLAGYEVLGGVEIDPEMMNHYRRNLRPKLSYLMPVQEFKKIPNSELPQELFSLDILDGSPPCSSFSMAGSREDAWSKEKKFREGQAKQVLDDLFFHYIDIAEKLKPKVVIAENVKGLILGKAKGYVKEIFQHFDRAGYDCQLFLLNASKMGVPQARERTFFIARRKNLNFPPIKISFNEPEIFVRTAIKDCPNRGESLSENAFKYWKLTKQGADFSDVHPTGGWFNSIKLNPERASYTITASACLYHYDQPRKLNKQEVYRLQSFPEDYSIGTQASNKATYICGMSVPPFMMQRLAMEIHRQWFKQSNQHESQSP